MERQKRNTLNGQICREAGEWFLEFRDSEPDARARGEFDLWIRRSPDHLAAYLEIAAIWNEAPALEAVEKSVLIGRALQDEGTVVPLEQQSRCLRVASKASHSASVYGRPGLKVAALLIVCLCAAVWLWRMNQPSYTTDLGEQRVIALQDGSRIELNSRSRLRVVYSDDERRVELLAGQALFSVAKDSKRPFVVRSGTAGVLAVGTVFDVYRKQSGTVVTVVEGQVAIRNHAQASDATKSSAVLVSAGQQLVITRSRIQAPTEANVSNVTAWTQRQLAFDAVALSEVAAEFNRYNERQLIVRDAEAVSFRISGVFSSSNPEGLIRFLRDRPGVRVVESPSQIVIEKTKNSGTENSGI
jgi:transmembrane sensor